MELPPRSAKEPLEHALGGFADGAFDPLDDLARGGGGEPRREIFGGVIDGAGETHGSPEVAIARLGEDPGAGTKEAIGGWTESDADFKVTTDREPAWTEERALDPQEPG